MSKARDLGNLLDTGGDVVSGSLDNVPTPSKTSIEALGIALPAANLTGTIANARIDLTPVHQSIATLGLHMGVSANAAAFNLPNAFIDTFEDDTGIATETTVDRSVSDEYVASVYQGPQVKISHSTGTAIGSVGGAGLAGLFSGSATTGQTSGIGTNDWAGKNWGSGVTKTISGITAWNNENTYGFNIGNANVIVTAQGSTDGSNWVTLGGTGWVPDGQGAAIPFKIEVLSGLNTSTAYQYHRILLNNTVDCRWSEMEFFETSQVTSATGTLISDTQTAPAATTEVSGVILYKDNAGTATLGTHLKIYFTANNGTNWTEAASYGTAQTFSGNVKMVRLGKTTVASGTQVKLKAVWANQSSGSKETRLDGWAVNY